MEEQLVSILIPVYNRVNLVGETINSAINQTYKNVEIIIIDNCSTDGTWELLQAFAAKNNRIRIFRNQENVGPVKNWERCIEKAKGKYSKLLYSDDTIEENFIEETLKLFDEQTAFVISKIKILEDDKEINFCTFKNKSVFTSNEYFASRILTNRYIFPLSPSSAIFRTDDLKVSLEIDIPNPFNLDFKKYGAGNDLLIFFNIALSFNMIKVATNTSSFFKSHADSFSASNNLNKYYFYTIIYFTQKHFPEYQSKLKTVLWLQMKKKKIGSDLYNLVDKKMDYLFIFNIITSRIRNKFFAIKIKKKQIT